MKLVLNDAKPTGRLIFGFVSVCAGIISLMSAAYGRGSSDGMKEGEEIGEYYTRGYYQKYWMPKEEESHADS